MPLTSASANLNPGDFSESSTYAVILLFTSSSLYLFANSNTCGALPIGIIATCLGAILGGNTNPASSL